MTLSDHSMREPQEDGPIHLVRRNERAMFLEITGAIVYTSCRG